MNVVNTAGASGNGGTAQCTTPGSASGPPFGSGTFCTDSASITTVAGDDFQAQKWIKADPALGFLNAAPARPFRSPIRSARSTPAGSGLHPLPVRGAGAAREQIDYLIRGINSGTNPAKQIVLVDGLPVQSDNGVLLSSQARGTEVEQPPGHELAGGQPRRLPRRGHRLHRCGLHRPGFCRASIQLPPNDQCPPGSFSAASARPTPGSRRSRRSPDGQLLNQGQSFTLAWSMTAPDSLTSASAEPVAWNSFAYRPTFQHGATQNTLPQPSRSRSASPCRWRTSLLRRPSWICRRCDCAALRVRLLVHIRGPRRWPRHVHARRRRQLDEFHGAFRVCLPRVGDQRPGRDVVQPGRGQRGDGHRQCHQSHGDDHQLLRHGLDHRRQVRHLGRRPPFPVGAAQFNVSCSFPDSGNVLLGYPQQFFLDDGSSTTLSGLPVGAACTVTETDTRGASTTSSNPPTPMR